MHIEIDVWVDDESQEWFGWWLYPDDDSEGRGDPVEFNAGRFMTHQDAKENALKILGERFPA